MAFFSKREDTYYQEFCDSSDCTGHYIAIIKNIKESTTQILCKKNAENYWKSVDSKINEIFKKLEKDNINQRPQREHQFEP